MTAVQPQVAVSDSAMDSASGLSAEEEQAYQEMMAARKAERKAWKQEMRRRAKFDPMAAPKRPGMTVANAPAGTNASADGTATAPATPAAAAAYEKYEQYVNEPKGRKAGRAGAAADPEDALDSQLDKWEQLLNFFESMERLFLGEGWEAELAELKAKVEASAQEVDAAMAAADAAEGGAGPFEGWRDEVSTLLLGLDDSEDPQLEYANRTALQALGFAAFDDATGGMAAAALADARHPASQAEWLWACTEAAERPEQFSTIPSLRLRGPGSGAPAVLARGVTVFRVDSLEGEPIGQAVLVESWRRLTAEEEAADEAA
eukprot:XP_001697119.1 predicted protein [Chlamydomonas reinhardtii]